jgi:diguanylate cyclase (GGDEF)-like protein
MLFASHELYLRRCVIAALKTKFAEGGCGMAHSTKTVEKFPEPGSELAISVGAIAEKLLQSIRDKGDRADADQRGLLERALAVATEAEQRLAEQSRRIALLEMLTLTDEITGLMNRRGFDRELRRALANARRYEECGVLALIDLDDFKTINDVYGHLAGDRVLRTIGQLLQLQIRENDSVARIGGDEFAILLAKCSAKKGIARAEEIEAMLNEHFVNFGGAAIPVRGSVGIAKFDKHDDSESLFARADRAMYQKKHQNLRERARSGHSLLLGPHMGESY